MTFHHHLKKINTGSLYVTSQYVLMLESLSVTINMYFKQAMAEVWSPRHFMKEQRKRFAGTEADSSEWHFKWEIPMTQAQLHSLNLRQDTVGNEQFSVCRIQCIRKLDD